MLKKNYDLKQNVQFQKARFRYLTEELHELLEHTEELERQYNVPNEERYSEKLTGKVQEEMKELFKFKQEGE